MLERVLDHEPLDLLSILKVESSMKSPLVHHVPGEPSASRSRILLETLYNLHRAVDATILPHVLLEPSAKLLVERGLLGTCTFSSGLDELSVGAQGDVLHFSLRARALSRTVILQHASTASP